MDHPGNGDFRARREASIWQRLNRILRALLGVAVALIVVSLFLPQHKKLTRGLAEVDDLQATVTKQKMVVARLTKEVNLLRTDPGYLEIFVRDRLDMMKPGETIIRLEPRK